MARGPKKNAKSGKKRASSREAEAKVRQDSARQDSRRDSRRDSRQDARRDQTQDDGTQRGTLHAFLEGLKFAASPQYIDAISQSLVTTVGSAPSVAIANSMLAANAAEGMMYYNAVAQQQKANLLGMAMTAKCVRYMLDGRQDAEDFDDIVDEILAKPANED